MKTSVQIGYVMGIPIRLHISFLLILPIFATVFSIAPEPFGYENVEPPLQYILGFTTAILLFTSVVLHELGHSYFAKKFGVKISNITLHLFGGVSSMEEIPRDPGQEGKMAFAGPLVSFIIGGTLLLTNFGLLSVLPDFIESYPYRIFFIIGTINIVLGLFNLIPAFPMDGGRILRSWFARRMSYIRATQRAASVGKFFAVFMGLIGLLINPWLILIAFFVYIGASQEAQSTTISITLEQYTVKDIMTTDVKSVSPSMTIQELLDFMFEKKHMGYPVIEGNDLKGVVSFTDARKVMPEERPAFHVSDVMTKDIISTTSDTNASEAFKLISRNNVGRLLVIDDGDLKGIVSRTDLIRTLRFMEEEAS